MEPSKVPLDRIRELVEVIQSLLTHRGSNGDIEFSLVLSKLREILPEVPTKPIFDAAERIGCIRVRPGPKNSPRVFWLGFPFGPSGVPNDIDSLIAQFKLEYQKKNKTKKKKKKSTSGTSPRKKWEEIEEFVSSHVEAATKRTLYLLGAWSRAPEEQMRESLVRHFFKRPEAPIAVTVFAPIPGEINLCNVLVTFTCEEDKLAAAASLRDDPNVVFYSVRLSGPCIFLHFRANNVVDPGFYRETPTKEGSCS